MASISCSPPPNSHIVTSNNHRSTLPLVSRRLVEVYRRSILQAASSRILQMAAHVGEVVARTEAFAVEPRVLEGLWIPMKDGTLLSAKVWLPPELTTTETTSAQFVENDAAALSPTMATYSKTFPSLLEYIPYRKNDGTLLRDTKRHAYMAAYGFVSIRVDIRGSGDSEGVMLDEYLQEYELNDCCEVIEWMASRWWSNGSVGMFGKSWGAFNSLQVSSANCPSSLKAVAAIAGTVDRYNEDVHYLSGCIEGLGLLPWAAVMLGYNSTPPDPQFPLPDDAKEGKQTWLERWVSTRLEPVPNFAYAWLTHQHRDQFWQHGSVCENDFAGLKLPTLAVGGWADGYTTMPFALAEKGTQRGVPCFGLVGPWAHQYPEESQPGPSVPFNQDMVRFWREYLGGKGKDEGIPAGYGPSHQRMRVYLLDYVPPCRTYHVERPGRWLVFDSWTPATRPRADVHLGPGGALVAAAPRSGFSVVVDGEYTLTGTQMGSWWGFGEKGEAAGNQMADDEHSACFDATLGDLVGAAVDPKGDGMVNVVGCPEVTIAVAVDQPIASVAVRICAVDYRKGTSLLLTWGVLNLTHRDYAQHTFSSPTPITPGTVYNVRVPMRHMAYRLPGNVTLRVAVSQYLWPMIWLPPKRVQLTVCGGTVGVPLAHESELSISEEARKVVLLEGLQPAVAKVVDHTELVPLTDRRSRTFNYSTKEVTLRLLEAEGTTLTHNNGIARGCTMVTTFQAACGDPLSAKCTVFHACWYRHAGKTVGSVKEGEPRYDAIAVTETTMGCTETQFQLTTTVRAYHRSNGGCCPLCSDEALAANESPRLTCACVKLVFERDEKKLIDRQLV